MLEIISSGQRFAERSDYSRERIAITSRSMRKLS